MASSFNCIVPRRPAAPPRGRTRAPPFLPSLSRHDDAQVSAAYWDFVADSERHGATRVTRRSEIFAPAWFGALDWDHAAGGDASSHVLDTRASRHFGELPRPRNFTAAEHNSYGFVTQVSGPPSRRPPLPPPSPPKENHGVRPRARAVSARLARARLAKRRAVWKHGGRVDRGPNHITGANSLCTAATAPQVYNQDASPFVTRAGAVCGSNETTNALGGGFPTCETVRWVLNASSLYDLYFRLDSGLHGGEYGLHLQARSRAVARRW